jgi:putative phosphonate catabolism associated alcohol dehydrogenase
MADQARAAVFEGAHRPIQVRSFPLPRLRPGEVLVQIRLATICGSDLHTYEGRRSTPCPTILGHEMLGTIVEVSPDASAQDHQGRPLHVGDRVVWSMLLSCGQCFYCTHDLPQKCDHLFKYGHARITPEHTLHGGLATHCHLLPGTQLFRVAEPLADQAACPAGCATATVAAALRHAGDLDNCVVLVQGAGMLGLTAAAWVRQRGARTVIVCDPRPGRLETARRFGATHLLRSDEATPAVRPQIDTWTDGRGVDVVLEMSGAPAAIAAGIELLRLGGRAVWVGAVFPADVEDFSAERVVRKHLSIHGVHNYLPADLAAALDFLGSVGQQFPFAELVGPTFPLDQVEAAFQHARLGTAFRVGIAT